MAYKQYNGLPCANCGADQGLLDTYGRERLYCSPACKQEAYRKRKAAKRNIQALLDAPALVQRWYLAGIAGETLEALRKLYITHGEDAATLATDALLLAVRDVREALKR